MSKFVQIDKSNAQSVMAIITNQYAFLTENQQVTASKFAHYTNKAEGKTVCVDTNLFNSVAQILIEKKIHLKDPRDSSTINNFMKTPHSTPVKKTWPACRDKDECQNEKCSFTHPNGKEKKNKIPCRFGNNCKNNNCSFLHPITS